MIPTSLKDAVSDAVHLGVCDFTESDGVGHCLYYTIAGYILASYATGLPFQPQVGSIHLLIDEPDGWFHMEAENGGMDRGEFHSWLVVPDADRTRAATWVDFSTRHWPELSQRTQRIQDALTSTYGTIFVMDPNQEQIPWSRGPMPNYLWLDDDTPPAWVQCIPDRQAMVTLIQYMAEHNSEIGKLHRAVAHHWKSIRNERGIFTMEEMEKL